MKGVYMNIFSVVSTGYKALRAGEQLSNPTFWKNGQVSVVYLAAFLSSCIAVVRSLGYEIPLTETELSGIASGILALVGLFNHFATVASTDKIDALGRTDANRVP